ncbi:MAG: hypothetical protein WED09_03790 [Homoserinimonas sp.]
MSANSKVRGVPLAERRIRSRSGVTVLAYKRDEAPWKNADL